MDRGWDCDALSDSDLHTVRSCSFWVEGVAMAVLGFVASVTNVISIYVFTRLALASALARH